MSDASADNLNSCINTKEDMPEKNLNSLSILLPAYNCDCTQLVTTLLRQCDAIKNMDYEIIIADDASTNEQSRKNNSLINNMPHCRCIINEKNLGRAANRNMLAREAKYQWLVFIDGDMMVRRVDFISTYLAARGDDVVYGGYVLGMPPQQGNLRYRYEMSFRNNADAYKRSRNQWANFHTSNFLVNRTTIIQHPLDENFNRYGYEDVAWGRSLYNLGIGINHIDNPVNFERYENNADFLAKTEESLTTLAAMEEQLKDFSHILYAAAKIKRYHLDGIAAQIFKFIKNYIRTNLKGNNPNLFLFKIYKLGYLLNIRK
jgi:glycosyltransferase involved in cell wall biosynthesis